MGGGGVMEGKRTTRGEVHFYPYTAYRYLKKSVNRQFWADKFETYELPVGLLYYTVHCPVWDLWMGILQLLSTA